MTDRQQLTGICQDCGNACSPSAKRCGTCHTESIKAQALPHRKPLSQPEVGDDPSQVAGKPATPGAVDAAMSRAKRPHRVPVGSADRLKYAQRPGYYRRVVNDDPQNPGRIQQHLDAGYTFVEDPGAKGGDITAHDPSIMSSTCVSKQVGGGVTGYLMEQPIEYRNEDLALQHQRISESEADMKRTMVSAPGRYGKADINNSPEERTPV
jgi:ribosomal protein L40E